MVLYYLKYRILDAARADCTTLFGGMTPEDDRRDTGASVEMVGRWSTVGESAGYCICRAESASMLHAWLLNWSSLATIECWPVVDDNQARRILRRQLEEKEEASYTVDYSRAIAGPKPGESLFWIEYQFYSDKREEGCALFARLTKDEDEADAGANTCYGRWHNLGNGSGVALCSSKSEEDLHTWTTHWMHVCECTVRPVVTDAECRKNIKAKPDFADKHAALMAAVGKKKSWFWR